MKRNHTFHIPVLGIGFTADTPIQVSHLGIDSVISLVDDLLLERLRKLYCAKFEMPYQEISDKFKDFRAQRITSYLNMVNKITKHKFEDLKKSTSGKSGEWRKYFDMLPAGSEIMDKIRNFKIDQIDFSEIGLRIRNSFSQGSIDVNIMTKLDKENYENGEKLPIEYNDAHAAVRGFANSDLSSSLVLSAGMNVRLYSYLEKFDDFYPDADGYIKKKLVIKVSDYRSALIQGKFLAKKGLWVSEYRIESGLNCGGHAFATEGYLMGPILSEFKRNKETLVQTVSEILNSALAAKNKPTLSQPTLKITAQGGVGTSDEHTFLLEHYQLDSVGWGSPFLLVPEVCSIDSKTVDLLKNAKEEDLYLSGISPLGVPFNSVRGNTKDIEKMANVTAGKHGSVCTKQYLTNNTEFGERALCTASKQYQRRKIKTLDKAELGTIQYNKEYAKIIDKSCLCVGLTTSTLLVNDLDTASDGEGVSVCPGPNMAYFSEEMTLSQMTDIIYGKMPSAKSDRPNMFVKEMRLYLDFLKNKIESTPKDAHFKQLKTLNDFIKNMSEGIAYYQSVFRNTRHQFSGENKQILLDFQSGKNKLNALKRKLQRLMPVLVTTGE